jgi:hypothetical protein
MKAIRRWDILGLILKSFFLFFLFVRHVGLLTDGQIEQLSQ